MYFTRVHNYLFCFKPFTRGTFDGKSRYFKCVAPKTTLTYNYVCSTK